MDNRHLIISVSSRFVVEAIFIFLIIVPFMNSFFQWIPYGSYFLIIGLLCVLFTIYSLYSLGHWIFVGTAFGLLLLFYLCNYPSLVNAFLSFALTWRYMVIRGQPHDQTIFRYLVLTSLFSMILVFITEDFRLLLLIGVQFLFILISTFFNGYNSFDYRALFYGLSVLLIGALSSLLLFHPIIKIWEYLQRSVFLILGRFVGLFDFLEGIRFQPRGPEIKDISGGEEEITSNEGSILEQLSVFFAGYLGITLIIIIAGIILLIFLLWKRLGKFSIQKEKDKSQHAATSKIPLASTFSLKRLVQKPAHPARKMVYDFEREMLKLQKGRQSSETIESWLQRLGMKSNLPTYQKVRYGDQLVSTEEIRILKREIDDLKETAKNEPTEKE